MLTASLNPGMPGGEMLVHGVPEDPSLSLFQGFRKQSSSPQSQAKGRQYLGIRRCLRFRCSAEVASSFFRRHEEILHFWILRAKNQRTVWIRSYVGESFPWCRSNKFHGVCRSSGQEETNPDLEAKKLNS